MKKGAQNDWGYSLCTTRTTICALVQWMLIIPEIIEMGDPSFGKSLGEFIVATLPKSSYIGVPQEALLYLFFLLN